MFFYGWITEEEVKKIMKRVPIFVRLTQHDGNSLAVTEALSYGCEVIWSYPYEKCYFANSIEELNQNIVELSNKIKSKLVPYGKASVIFIGTQILAPVTYGPEGSDLISIFCPFPIKDRKTTPSVKNIFINFFITKV